MEYTIENKTILLPEIIAEGAIWEVLDRESKTKDLSPEKCYQLQEEIRPLLVKRANIHYQENKFFRAQITSNEKGRNTLWAFMEHWTLSVLKNKKLI